MQLRNGGRRENEPARWRRQGMMKRYAEKQMSAEATAEEGRQLCHLPLGANSRGK